LGDEQLKGVVLAFLAFINGCADPIPLYYLQDSSIGDILTYDDDQISVVATIPIQYQLHPLTLDMIPDPNVNLEYTSDEFWTR